MRAQKFNDQQKKKVADGEEGRVMKKMLYISSTFPLLATLMKKELIFFRI